MAGGKARCAAAIDAVTLRCKWRRRGGRGREGGAFVHCDQRMANRKIGEAKKMTKFEVNPANLSGFWREI